MDMPQKWCEAKLLKPQRLMNITVEQEHFRVEQSWMLIDKQLHLVSFGTAEELSTQVGKPEQFIEGRKRTVIIQSDQIPFYCKVQPEKQLYSKKELRNTSGTSEKTAWDEMGSLSGVRRRGG